MCSLDTKTLSSLFLLPENIAVEAVYPTKRLLTLQISCTLMSACCPLCQQSSERIHGRYGRTVADVPCGGRLVTLALTVRKFVCGTKTCPRRIFTERLPDLVQSYARMTNRLSEVLQTLGFATCGELGERFAPKLGMQVSGPTLLRRMRTRSCPVPSSVRILGIDDWCWKKGMTYGTILVDLELRKPIELLPDRTTETAEAWLRTHPEVEIVSRDRGGNYASAARKGAPQAQQVADKFHLLKNLREKLKDLMVRKQKYLPEVEDATSDGVPRHAQGKPQESIRAAGSQQEGQEKHFRSMSQEPRRSAHKSSGISAAEHRSQVSRANRYVRYEAVRALHQQAFSDREIARRLKLSRQTVHQFIVAEAFPEISRPPYRGSLLDPYKPYILQRWQEGCWNGTQIYTEIKARGYSGSDSLFRLFIRDLRKKHQAAGTSAVLTLDASGATVNVPSELPPKPCPKNRMSPTRASWLCVSQPKKLDEKQLRQVELIRAGHTNLDTAYQISQAFVSMLAERRDKDLDGWLVQAEQSGITELKSFAQGIHCDYAAVRAAFTSPWSNGQVEAQVNCLKLQKRIVFGRANFDLLRLRVLCRV
jgi:transposase